MIGCRKKDGKWVQGKNAVVPEEPANCKCYEGLRECAEGKIDRIIWDIIDPTWSCGDLPKETLKKKAIKRLRSDEFIEYLEDIGVTDPKGMRTILLKKANELIAQGVTKKPVVKPEKQKYIQETKYDPQRLFC